MKNYCYIPLNNRTSAITLKPKTNHSAISFFYALPTKPKNLERILLVNSGRSIKEYKTGSRQAAHVVN